MAAAGNFTLLDLRVAILLLSWWNPRKGGAHPALETMAAALKTPKASIVRSLKRLERAAVFEIHREGRGRGHANFYVPRGDIIPSASPMKSALNRSREKGRVGDTVPAKAPAGKARKGITAWHEGYQPTVERVSARSGNGIARVTPYPYYTIEENGVYNTAPPPGGEGASVSVGDIEIVGVRTDDFSDRDRAAADDAPAPPGAERRRARAPATAAPDRDLGITAEVSGSSPGAPTDISLLAVDFWNTMVAGTEVPMIAKVTSQRASKLRRILLEFDNDLDRWRQYVQAILDSPFLCGENERGWRANIDWALQPRSVLKVREGHYRPSSRRRHVRLTGTTRATLNIISRLRRERGDLPGFGSAAEPATDGRDEHGALPEYLGED